MEKDAKIFENDGYWQDDFDPEYSDCHRCDNTGMILICPDDMCHGLGYCMHGDGEIICPECKGNSAW